MDTQNGGVEAQNGAVETQNEAWRLKMEAWRPKMEPMRVCRPVTADSHHFEEEQDPDPYYSKNRIRIRTKVKIWIRIRIKVKRWIPVWIRNPGSESCPNYDKNNAFSISYFLRMLKMVHIPAEKSMIRSR